MPASGPHLPQDAPGGTGQYPPTPALRSRQRLADNPTVVENVVGTRLQGLVLVNAQVESLKRCQGS